MGEAFKGQKVQPVQTPVKEEWPGWEQGAQQLFTQFSQALGQPWAGPGMSMLAAPSRALQQMLRPEWLTQRTPAMEQLRNAWLTQGRRSGEEAQRAAMDVSARLGQSPLSSVALGRIADARLRAGEDVNARIAGAEFQDYLQRMGLQGSAAMQDWAGRPARATAAGNLGWMPAQMMLRYVMGGQPQYQVDMPAYERSPFEEFFMPLIQAYSTKQMPGIFGSPS
jgi:hypothetical protein